MKLDAAVTSPVFATNMAADSTCFVSMRQPSNNFGNGFIFIRNTLPQKVFNFKGLLEMLSIHNFVAERCRP